MKKTLILPISFLVKSEGLIILAIIPDRKKKNADPRKMQ